MVKMTKAQARKRLLEAHTKLTKVYFAFNGRVLSLSQIQDIDKIINRALKFTKN